MMKGRETGPSALRNEPTLKQVEMFEIGREKADATAFEFGSFLICAQAVTAMIFWRSSNRFAWIKG
jgi:hypothetical protein